MKTWRERIAEARERGGYTEEDSHLGTDFATCAVGEVCAAYGIERDEVLEELGYDFTGLVVYGGVEYDDADLLLDAIEDRALQLKLEAHP